MSSQSLLSSPISDKFLMANSVSIIKRFNSTIGLGGKLVTMFGVLGVGGAKVRRSFSVVGRSLVSKSEKPHTCRIGISLSDARNR